MFYAVLAYHVEDTVQSWTPDEDAALMKDLLEVNTRLTREGKLGPAARLGPTAEAVTLRGPADAMVIDGPFAETKELIAGYWLWQVKSMQEAIEWAKRCPNPTGEESVLEIRPIFEAEDFGEEFTPELREQEERIRIQAEELQKKKA